jgi:hypothetical protein
MPNQESVNLWQGNREITLDDIAYIRTFAQQFPGLSRKELTNTLCEHLNWMTAAGQPKYTACSKLLLRLEATGKVVLPLTRKYSRTSSRKTPTIPFSAKTAPEELLKKPLSELEPILLKQVDRKNERLWNEYVDRHHPLGYKKPFGYWMRYFIESGPHLLGCILLAGASKALSAREQWIGWTEKQRLRNLPWVVNNSRFLIFPWVEVTHLASHVLGRLVRQLADDWEMRWGFRPILLETFVDPRHFAGTCYKAAGWELLGRTTGEGMVRPGKQYQTHSKLIFAKPLHADFRHQLCSDKLQGRHEP